MNLGPYRKIALDGLWHNNQALVALLGLCPLLAVSSTVVNSLGLGLATTVALVFSNGVVSLVRNHITPEVRLPVFVLVIAANVTVIELLMSAFFHDLYKILGIFIPLIVTNCAIIGRAEAFASKNTVDRAVLDGLFMGLGFTAALMALGAFREIIGTGALLNRAELMFGEGARNWSMRIIENYDGFLLAVLPPGAFIGLGLIIALKNVIDARANVRSHATAPQTASFDPAARKA
ncbi:MULTISPECIES: electron transport complex subunit E [Methylococcus]|uniref:Ion-translocating oxidoreductase complex subunit E n=1 Tax=Methylococcus capsulatus TaxID=414 RepID=A0ABZ2F6A0_METCP|nr:MULTISPECIES: electron transport complex subunit E [Methylococcus]MDF9393653.1 electron transport complex subunit E [Methylococcus capsulatus]